MATALSAVLLLVGCTFFQEIQGEVPVILSHLRTTNVDVSFARWPKGTPVSYCFDTASPLTSTEQALVTSSLTTLTNTLGSCMTFSKLDSCSGSTYKLRFTAITDVQTPSYAYPGINLKNRDTDKKTDQPVGLARDATNCQTDPRCIMKFGAISLGKRNEHERKDRDNYIAVNNPNILFQYSGAYRLYNTSEAYWGMYPYDYCSITHNRMPDYAQPGTLAFTVKNAPYCIPQMSTISKTDCILLNRLYSCDYSICNALPDCSTVACPTTTVGSTTSTTPATTPPPTTTLHPTTTLGSTTTGTTTAAATTTAATTSTTASTTSTSTSTTTSTTTTSTTTMPPPCIDFCLETTKIDEASKLFNGNYYLFSGNCMVQIDAYNKMIGPSVKISTILPGITGPVTSVWTDQRSISYVLAGTVEYVCFGGRCQSITPVPASDTPMVRWEGSGATTYTYDRAGNYYNDMSGNTAPIPIAIGISCGTNPCLIDPTKWNAVYTIPLFGLQITNVIGTDGAGTTRYLMPMVKTDTISPGTAIPGPWPTGTADNYERIKDNALTSLLGCPNAAAG